MALNLIDVKSHPLFYRGVFHMSQSFLTNLQNQIDELHTTGLYKDERVIDSHQKADIHVSTGEMYSTFAPIIT